MIVRGHHPMLTEPIDIEIPDGSALAVFLKAYDIDRVSLGCMTTTCACSHCSEPVTEGEYAYPYCNRCYANIDGKCD